VIFIHVYHFNHLQKRTPRYQYSAVDIGCPRAPFGNQFLLCVFLRQNVEKPVGYVKNMNYYPACPSKQIRPPLYDTP